MTLRAALIAATLVSAAPALAQKLPLERIKLPPGFSIELFARAVSYQPFAEGWLQGDSAWGRPVDLQELPDGSLLVSDDHAGAIYRIRYAK